MNNQSFKVSTEDYAIILYKGRFHENQLFSSNTSFLLYLFLKIVVKTKFYLLKGYFNPFNFSNNFINITSSYQSGERSWTFWPESLKDEVFPFQRLLQTLYFSAWPYTSLNCPVYEAMYPYGAPSKGGSYLVNSSARLFCHPYRNQFQFKVNQTRMICTTNLSTIHWWRVSSLILE